MEAARKPGLTVRLAASADDIHAAQRLRYQVFYEEKAAVADARTVQTGRDEDRFDAFCDHLLVIDTAAPAPAGLAVDGGRLVGTYRLLRQEVAAANGGFYTASEFNIAPLLARKRDLCFLEVGRSCVANGFRGRPVAELLWQGIWNYVRAHGLDVMMGCASLDGTEPASLADELTFLAHAAPPPVDWQVRALPPHGVAMAMKPVAEVDGKAVLRRLPTLVKAYLRLGCYIAGEAVIDRQFNTTDVLILLPVAAINPRYFAHYGAPGAATG